MQQNTVYLNLSTDQNISGGISTHHQELISLYLQYLALMRPLLPPIVNVAGRPFPFPLLAALDGRGYGSGDQMEKNEMGGACSTYGEEQRYIKGFGGET